MTDNPPDLFGRTVFETLLSNGDRVQEVAPGQHVCDFCLSPNPTWEYPCGYVELMVPIPGEGIDSSNDPWAACERCHELIEAGYYDTLVSHCADTQGKLQLAPGFFPLPRRERVKILRHNVREFKRARQGDPRRYA